MRDVKEESGRCARYDPAEYVTPRQAIELLLSRADTELEAKEAVADGLRSGRVRCYAAQAWSTDRGSIYDTVRPTGRIDIDVDPTEMFAASRQWPSELPHWKWDTGEFVIFLSEEELGRPLRIHMAGVTLHRADVLRLIGQSSRAGIGGRPRKNEAWRAFWHAVVTLAAEDKLNRDTFPTQRALRAKVAGLIDEALTEGSIKGEIKLIWERFIESTG